MSAFKIGLSQEENENEILNFHFLCRDSMSEKYNNLEKLEIGAILTTLLFIFGKQKTKGKILINKIMEITADY